MNNWKQLEKIAPPEKWLQMYADYQDLLVQNDAMNWLNDEGVLFANLFNDIKRVEVIDQNGRSYVNWNENNKVKPSFQDDNHTLKIFIDR